MAFTVTLIGQSEYFQGKGDIELEVKITNNHPHDYFLFQYHTPLDHNSSDIFHIICDGRLLPYVGIMVKRGPPSPEECIEIKAHSTKSVTVNLTHGYTFDNLGNHTVQLKTIFKYHKRGGSFLEHKQAIASNTVTFRVLPIPPHLECTSPPGTD